MMEQNESEECLEWLDAMEIGTRLSDYQEQSTTRSTED